MRQDRIQLSYTAPMNQKGFAHIVAILLIGIAAIGVGVYLLVGASKSGGYNEPTGPLTQEEAYQEIAEEIQDRGVARVIVGVRGNEFTAAEYQDDLTKKDAEIKRVVGQEVATLSVEDMEVDHQFKYIPYFSGLLKAPGLEKLRNNPEITSMQLDRPIPAPAQ